MDRGGYSDRWRHRAWQVESASADPDTASFDEHSASEDLTTSSFQPGPVTPVASADVPEPSERLVATTCEIGPGSVLRNRYLIEKRIGEGGTSEVFSALDRHRGNGAEGFNRVAIKILHSRYRNDEPRTERLLREFRHMQRLTHPGIARVYDLDCENGLWFITMELLEGRPLSRHIRNGLKDGEAQLILTQCAEALAFAHDHAVVHGDLKPSNIFMTRDGSVRLLDFGSVPSQNEASTQNPGHRRFAATPPYASPELLDGQEAQPLDDIFSLGCVAYELFSGGQHPFSRKSSLDARQQQLRPIYHGSMRPRHFAVIAQALSWDRNARPATARDFLHDFLASHFDHEATPQTTAAESKPESAKTPDNDAAVVAKAPTESMTAQPKQAEPVGAAIDPLLKRAAPIEATGAATAAEATHAKPAGPIFGATSQSSQAAGATVASAGQQHGTSNPAAQPRSPDRTAACATQQSKSASSTAAANAPEPTAHSYEEARARFAEPIPVELLVSTPRFAAEAPLPTPQLTIGALRRPRWFWLRPALLAAVFVLTVVVTVLLWQQFMMQQAAPPPVQQPTRSIPPPAAPVAAVADPMPVAAEPEPAPAEAPAPETRQAAPRRVGTVAFESATVRVGPSQSIAAVNVRRTETAGTSQIVWSTVAGSAKPGVDFEPVDSQVVRLHQGQGVRSLYITIKHPPGADKERRFSVRLEKTSRGPALGEPTEAQIIISPAPGAGASEL